MATLRDPYNTYDLTPNHDQYLGGLDPNAYSGDWTANSASTDLAPDTSGVGRTKNQPVPTGGNGATPPPSAPTPPSLGLDQISSLYQRYLGGRKAGYYNDGTVDPAESADALNKAYGGMDYATAENAIKNSPEAQAAAAKTSNNDMSDQLAKLLNGNFNQAAVNNRVDAARDTLNRQRKSMLATDQAALASRGLIGSGPESTALNYLDTNLGGQFANAVNNIYADESDKANQAAIGGFNAETGRTGTLGNLALGNLNAVNSNNLGVGQLGLQRDIAEHQLNNADIGQLIQLIQQLYGGANTSAEGYYNG